MPVRLEKEDFAENENLKGFIFKYFMEQPSDAAGPRVSQPCEAT